MIRRVVFLASVVALTPAMAATALAEPGEAGQLAFMPPEATQVLTRTVNRSLPGGREIRVRRSYRISFVRIGDGYRVDGELIVAEVDAPQAVSGLAELERNRPDTGLFPIFLDTNGRIVAHAQPAPSLAVSQGAGLAIERIGNSGLSPTDQAEALSFVRQVAQQGGNVAWPSDLFNPFPGNRTETRRVPLPQGGEGEISISIDAQADPVQHYLRSIDRVVITRLGDSERLSRESWTMTPFTPVNQLPPN